MRGGGCDAVRKVSAALPDIIEVPSAGSFARYSGNREIHTLSIGDQSCLNFRVSCPRKHLRVPIHVFITVINLTNLLHFLLPLVIYPLSSTPFSSSGSPLRWHLLTLATGVTPFMGLTLLRRLHLPWRSLTDLFSRPETSSALYSLKDLTPASRISVKQVHASILT